MMLAELLLLLVKIGAPVAVVIALIIFGLRSYMAALDNE